MKNSRKTIVGFCNTVTVEAINNINIKINHDERDDTHRNYIWTIIIDIFACCELQNRRRKPNPLNLP